MKIELKPTEVVQIDIYQFNDNRNRESAGYSAINMDYALNLEVEYTFKDNGEYSFCRRFYGTTYKELFGGAFLDCLFDDATEDVSVDEISKIPVRLHLFDRHNMRKGDER